jgi:hypothetical protein
VQEAPTAIEPAQVLLRVGTVKAALLETIELMVSGALPQFVACTLCEAVV